jgi:hypothetical protein
MKITAADQHYLDLLTKWGSAMLQRDGSAIVVNKGEIIGRDRVERLLGLGLCEEGQDGLFGGFHQTIRPVQGNAQMT